MSSARHMPGIQHGTQSVLEKCYILTVVLQ